MSPSDGCWAVVAARMGSSRLPGKSMADLNGRPAFARIVERLSYSEHLAGIVLATTDAREDDLLASLARTLGVPLFRGSAGDVLERTLGAARSVEAKTIVQVTGDCPLIDPEIVDRVIGIYLEERPDYAANVIPPTYPNGMDTEVFSESVLCEVDRLTSDPVDREHVSLFIYEHPDRYVLRNVTAPAGLARPEVRLCVDTEQDLRLVRAVYEALDDLGPAFGLAAILEYLDSHPEVASINAGIRQKAPRT